MKYMDLFDKRKQKLAKRFLDYYDGKSKEYLDEFIKMHRKNSVKKGMIARTRNLTKMIVDKSALLFSGKAPLIEVYRNDAVDDAASATALAMLESADWVEFFTNFDAIVRMLKTGIVLIQVNPETRKFVLEALDAHNAAIGYNAYKEMELLIYRTGYNDKYTEYRVWEVDRYFDLRVDPYGEEEIVPGSIQPNPFGLIPAVLFHDTNVPRKGGFNEIPDDLIDINDIYNLHITDSEYASMWAKMPTLFTTATIQGQQGTTMVTYQGPEDKLPRWIPSNEPGFVGGPGTVVGIETNGEAVFLEYKAPNPPLQQLDQVILQWVNDFAQDWRVSISADGNGNADSGFKLVVKELPNLELRKQRQRMFEAGFHRMYEVLMAVGASVQIFLPEDGELFVTFAPPDLPVDERATEEIWSRKIHEKRASRLDYFMEVKGMSELEARAKIQSIDAEAPITPNRPAPTSVIQTEVSV